MNADTIEKINKIANSDVAAVFASYPESAITELLNLRLIILATAAVTPDVGRIDETLKWGQPAYLTSETKSGSTIRIAARAPQSGRDCAMYFICSTNLVSAFEDVFGDAFSYETNEHCSSGWMSLSRNLPCERASLWR